MTTDPKPNPPIQPDPNNPSPLPAPPAPQPAVINASPVDVPAFGTLVKDSIYADGKGGTMTAAQYWDEVVV